MKLMENKLSWANIIKWDIKWIQYFRNRIEDLRIFVFKLHCDNNNPMQIFKDYPYFFKFTNKLYQVDNDIRYWVRNGMSYPRFMKLENVKALHSALESAFESGLGNDMIYRDGHND